jgi:hypothetical protein
MPTTIFEYEGALRGPSWQESSTSAQDGSWSMRFKADGKTLSLRVSVPSKASVVDAAPIAESAVTSFLAALVTSPDVILCVAYLERPACVSSRVVDEGSIGSMTATAMSRVAVTAELTAIVASGIVNNIGADAASGVPPKPRASELAEALRARDPMVRFVRLYELLGKFAGTTNQQSLDAVIEKRSRVPVPKSPNPNPRRRDDVDETIYRRLRNEIAHPADRCADLGVLAREVGEQIGKLQTLVAELI